jgi:hypothetical protein
VLRNKIIDNFEDLILLLFSLRICSAFENILSLRQQQHKAFSSLQCKVLSFHQCRGSLVLGSVGSAIYLSSSMVLAAVGLLSAIYFLIKLLPNFGITCGNCLVCTHSSESTPSIDATDFSQ